MKKRIQLGIILSLVFVSIKTQSAFSLSLSMTENNFIHSPIITNPSEFIEIMDNIHTEQNYVLDGNFIFGMPKPCEYVGTKKIAIGSEQATNGIRFVHQNAIIAHDDSYTQVICYDKSLNLMTSGITFENQLEDSDDSHSFPWNSIQAYGSFQSDSSYLKDTKNNGFSDRIEPDTIVKSYTNDFKLKTAYPIASKMANPVQTISGSIEHAEVIVSPKHIFLVLLWVGLLGLAFRN